MRIVAGKFRAKKLFGPTHNIRPTLDKVKQALFTRLQFFVEGKSVLDLFSGSGALGIEALSRNAKSVVFCDANQKSIDLTKKNLATLKTDKSQEIKVYKTDYLTFLKSTKQKFDLIILDPPYENGFYLPALEQIFESKLLNNEGIIVCEHLRKDILEQNFFQLDAKKDYGSVTLEYFKSKI